MFRTLDDLPDGRRVLVRIDINSPVEDGEVRDDRRFERHAKTLVETPAPEFGAYVRAPTGEPLPAIEALER